MKKYISLFQLLTVLLTPNIFKATAQDSSYYVPAFNHKGQELKKELYKLIKNHRQYPYTSSSTDVWDVLKVTDRDTVNPDNVILIYSGRSVNAAQEYNGGAGWTREHVWAKSRGDFGNAEGAGTDVHHLRPCDNSINSTRNNRNFDNCSNCENVIDEGVSTGSKKDRNQWTFEPRDDVKGDVARMIFYMAVRYEGENGEPDLELTTTHLSRSDKRPLHANYETLLEWHFNDPVSNWERNRNQLIYDQFQGNRNPFIDYPELASYLWAADTSNVWMSSDTGATTSTEDVKNLPILQFFPNPTSSELNINFLLPQVTVFNSNGEIVLQDFNKKCLLVGHLASGVYYLKAEGYKITPFIKK